MDSRRAAWGPTTLGFGCLAAGFAETQHHTPQHVSTAEHSSGLRQSHPVMER